jgi:DNA adenine methylase
MSAAAGSLLRYHGGKWLLGPWIVGHFPRHTTYVEPFGGGGSVLLQKPRSYGEVYNDLDGEVVNVFRVVRDHGEELVRLLELTPYSRDEFELAFVPAECPIEQARRTVLRSYAGFGSTMTARRVDGTRERTGFRSVGRGAGTHHAMVWRNYPAKLVHLVERLRGVVIENRDATECMRQHDAADTLHYVDPPYVQETRHKKRRGRAYAHELDEAAHVRLAEQLHELAGFVILSGYRCALYDQHFAGWRRIERRAHADGAVARTECLWLSPSVPACGLF